MSPASLELEVWIAADPAVVFSFFTDADDFASWMGGAMGTATVEARVGGEVRVAYGMGMTAAGQVVALEAPHHFAFTWGYLGGQPFAAGSTRVDIRLTAERGGTRLVLQHSGLPGEGPAADHASGWRLYTGMLAARAARKAHGSALNDKVEAWFEAWNTEDDAIREASLRACLAEGGSFRDDAAAVVGLAPLLGHIINSRRFMEGVRLVGTGPCTQSHHLVHFPWEARRAGEVLVRGVNVAEIAADGRFESVVGFRLPY